ncbi:hypothetical protein [Roseivirga pacifica]|uniref:hypothetical protein n=1 Tax=Roseivirga pacifica TaxID=1267423 RepID=UPI003BB01E1D
MKKSKAKLSAIIIALGIIFSPILTIASGGALSWEPINSHWDGNAWQVLERCEGSGSTCSYDQAGEYRAITKKPER